MRALIRFGLSLALATVITACPAGTTTPDAGPSCTAGSAGCACHADSTCLDGLVCSENLCTEPPRSGLHVTEDSARACEVRFREEGTTILDADFTSGVRGHLVREAPSVAIAFTGSTDAPLPHGSVSLRLSGPASGLSVREAHCFDRLGQPLPAAQVTLE